MENSSRNASRAEFPQSSPCVWGDEESPPGNRRRAFQTVLSGEAFGRSWFRTIQKDSMTPLVSCMFQRVNKGHAIVLGATNLQDAFQVRNVIKGVTSNIQHSVRDTLATNTSPGQSCLATPSRTTLWRIFGRRVSGTIEGVVDLVICTQPCFSGCTYVFILLIHNRARILQRASESVHGLVL